MARIFYCSKSATKAYINPLIPGPWPPRCVMVSAPARRSGAAYLAKPTYPEQSREIAMKAKLQVLEQDIATYTKDGMEYICITDIARYKDSDRTGVIIGNWLRNRNTIEFLGIWEQLNNPDFKVIRSEEHTSELQSRPH